MTTQKLPIALVGGGEIAPYHATYLLSSKTVYLVAIIDPFPPGKALAAKLSIPHFTSIETLLSSSCPKPHAYIICTPSGTHASITSTIIKSARPKAILIEKPVTTDSASGNALIKLAAEYGTTILVGHHRRFHAQLVGARDLIETGKLGKVIAVSGLWTIKKSNGYFAANKWRSSRTGGGGPVWTNLIHDIDALHFLIGSRVTRVWATQTKTQRTHENVPQNDRVEEGAAIMLQFASGIVGTFILCDNVTSPYNWESATGENPSIPKSEIPVDSYRVFGTDGSLSIPNGVLWEYKDDFVTQSGKEKSWNVPISGNSLDFDSGIPFREQLEHLGRVVRGLETPRCSGDEGLAAVRVCEAVIQALDTGNSHPIDINVSNAGHKQGQMKL